jgi:hypothetical protein
MSQGIPQVHPRVKDELLMVDGFLNIGGFPLRTLVTPRQLVEKLNIIILEEQHSRWNELAGRSLQSPEITPAICRTRGCHNSAIVFPFCQACCRWKYHVQVRPSTISGAGLGLFANKNFKAGEYVCDYCFNMIPNQKGSFFSVLDLA